MKTKYIYIAVLCALMTSCSLRNVKSIEFCLLMDRTDDRIVFPNNDDVLSFCELDESVNNEVAVTMQSLGDTDYSKPVNFYLEGNPDVTANELERKAEVDAFKAQIKAALSNERAANKDYDNSAIVGPLVQYLIKMSESSAHVREIYLYSDLAQHSLEFSVADNETWYEINQTPEVAARKLFKGYKLPNLEGVTLHIIHYPYTQKENAKFNALLKVFKIGLENTGLVIQIGDE